MKMGPEQFKENILLYGVDLHQWPGGIREAGTELLQNSPELQAFLAEHERFERVLKARKYEEPSDNLARRIISISLQQEEKSSFSIRMSLSRLFAREFYLPKAAFRVVVVLIIAALLAGFVIGFSNSQESLMADQRQIGLQAFLHYEEGGL
jgi:hypothetical protein